MSEMDEAMEAAALWGVADNPAFPTEERLACALMALAYYGREVGGAT